MKGFYINLDQRTDRRAEVEAELKGQDVERFPAVFHSNGLAGCAMSHIACLKLAKERGYPEVMIFEDDFMWLGERTIPKLPENQDVCCLAQNTPNLIQYNAHWSRGFMIQTTSGYIAHERMQEPLIQCWEESIPRLLETGRHWEQALDQQWKPLHNAHNFQCSTPRLGKQRPSQSDLGKKFSDQGGV